MKILALKPGHDSSIAYIADGKLIFSIEAEKDSFPRFSEISAPLVVEALEMAPDIPDVVAVGGWHKELPEIYSEIATGYSGLQKIQVRDGYFFGKRVKLFSSSHERSHIFMAAAMAPWAPIEECVVLLWEGVIGAFYHWQDYGSKLSHIDVLTQPGARYSALYALADPDFPDHNADPRNDYAGKLMALAAYADSGEITSEDRAVVENLLMIKTLYPFAKAAYRDSKLYNCGIHTSRMHLAARYMTDRLFQIFLDAAIHLLPHDCPLIITGGCGLNCEWNQRWRECGLFSDVFVPPCANDSGSAIGSGADAMAYFGEPCRLEWTVYSGASFISDVEPDPVHWDCRPIDFNAIAHCLAQDKIFAWIQGRYEIGPRALGHRSLLASPLTKSNKDILNRIKEREDYRPIAPCCLYEELDKYFEPSIDDPYMLYFSRAKIPSFPAAIHIDGTARVQSVRVDTEPVLHQLLTAFKGVTGYGLLCNTSLNFKGMGFINRTSELLLYCDIKGINEVVLDDVWYSRSVVTDNGDSKIDISS